MKTINNSLAIPPTHSLPTFHPPSALPMPVVSELSEIVGVTVEKQTIMGGDGFAVSV